MDCDYDSIDASDPPLNVSWLSSFPLFGFSARDPSDPRYRALAKFNRLAATHGVEDVTLSDFLRALALYIKMLDRPARSRCPADPRAVTPAAAPADAPADAPATTPTVAPAIRLARHALPEFHPEGDDEHLAHHSTARWSFELDVRYDRLFLPDDVLPERRWSLPERIAHPLAKPSPASSILRPRDSAPSPPSTPPSTPPPPPVKPEHVQLLYHMLRHAESIYGFPISIPSAPIVSVTRVTDQGIITSRTGVSNADLKLSSTATAFLPAHYVAVDRQIRAVVICVRGTANLLDSLTDVAATQDPLKMCREPQQQQQQPHAEAEADADAPTVAAFADVLEGYGHAGVLRSARNLFDRIREDALRALDANPGFELFVTGHSLGAATASVLALIMREDPDFPRALAFCFAPLPCMTYELAERASEFTITVVNGPDVVPRLSVAMLQPYFATARYVADLSKTRKTMLSLGLRAVAVSWQELERRVEQKLRSGQDNHAEQRLYIPGKVFHLMRKTDVKKRDAVRRQLFRQRTVEVVPVRRTDFMEINARERGMFLAHGPFNYRSSLLLALKGMGAEPLRAMAGGSVFRNLLTVPVARILSKNEAQKRDDDALKTLVVRLEHSDGSPLPL